MTRTASNLLNSVLLDLVIICRAQAQGTFVNLDFEAANVPDLPPGQGGAVAVADGVPGWTVYIGLGQPSSMGHNTISLGGADVEIYGPQWPSDQILQGSYTVFLLGSFMSPVVQAAAIGQTGQIPPTVRSLQF